jgi:hypothetical protein
MSTPNRAGLFVLTILTLSACDQSRLSKCQEFSRSIAETGSAVMHHPLDSARFEAILTRADGQIATLSGVPELDHAKGVYKDKMRAAIAKATRASATDSRPARIDANASARADAANATYHLMESTNLHCSGER